MFSPHVSPQGSFRLGTVTRPWKREDYDLDLTCKLQKGLTKSLHTQRELKHLVGFDLKNYQQERGIKEKPACNIKNVKLQESIKLLPDGKKPGKIGSGMDHGDE